MNDTSSVQRCLNCQRPETIIPLITLRYAGGQAWICSQCLPILIHQPQELAGKLIDAEDLLPFQDDRS